MDYLPNNCCRYLNTKCSVFITFAALAANFFDIFHSGKNNHKKLLVKATNLIHIRKLDSGTDCRARTASTWPCMAGLNLAS